MHHSQIIFKFGIAGFVFFWIISFSSQAQDYYKFPITQAGVYRLDLAQARGFGFENLEQIGLFGNPGMLPQGLESKDLDLREIPTQKIGESLYFFLEGPHIFDFRNNNVHYVHHLYADTIYYLFGPKQLGKAVSAAAPGGPAEPSESFFLQQVQALKWEETNLINSGRSWFSKPIFSGQTYTFGFDLPIGAEGPYRVDLALMSQAVAEGRFRVNASGQTIGEESIPAVPNTTYGIKGRESKVSLPFNSNNPSRINFNLLFQTSDPNGTGYIDHAILFSKMKGSSLAAGVYFNMDGALKVQLPPSIKAWEVTDFFDVRELPSDPSLAQGSKLALFDPLSAPKIEGMTPADLSHRNPGTGSELLILTHRSLQSQAQRLANHKSQIGIQASVVLLEDLYQSFGYGTKDLSAIRNFIAFQFHTFHKLRNVLILGKGTYDYKGKLGGRPNLFPIYTSRNSLNPLTTYSSDDFFGFLEWGQGMWLEDQAGDELLQIGVGRLPAANIREATEMVDKIISYETVLGNPGPWKRRLAFLTDDGDNNIHLRDAESHSLYLTENHPEFEIRKLYLDRFEQIRNGNAQTSPEARIALTDAIEDGVLVLNYIGHGNETTLTSERIFSTLDLIDWPTNPYLPLFVTATCEFGRHDSPFSRSGAEELMYAEKKGAIALLTTGRPVFSSVNFALNTAFIESVFEKENGTYRDLGTIFKITKNNSLNGTLNRNFSLLGDPSLRLDLPDFSATIDRIVESGSETPTDALSPLKEFRIEGIVSDPLTGATMMQANGEFQIKVMDKAQTFRTLGDESTPADFEEEGAVLFQGKGEVKDGKFLSVIFLPEKSSATIETVNIRLFATVPNLKAEAMGISQIPINYENNQPNQDNQGPTISMLFGPDRVEAPAQFDFKNLPAFISLSDPSGIKVSSTDPARNIQLSVNGGPATILNHLYFAKNGSYQEGEIETLLPGLRDGANTITLEAWDNVGNRSLVQAELEIRGSQFLSILECVSYPNPATNYSKFKIKHNRPGETLRIELEIYSILGSKIYSDGRRYINADFELEAPEWNFFHSSSKYPVKGTYIYRLLLISEKDGTTDSKSGKITIQ
mgnify:CR=1 FL=1